MTYAQDVEIIYAFITSLKPARIPAEQAQQIAHYCVRFGEQFHVDPLLLAALMYRESTFNPRAISTSNAQGLGQIKPMNFKDLGITDPFNIEQNIKGTAQYLSHMISLWHREAEQSVPYGLASYYNGYTGFKRENKQLIGKVGDYVRAIMQQYHKLLLQKNSVAAA